MSDGWVLGYVHLQIYQVLLYFSPKWLHRFMVLPVMIFAYLVGGELIQLLVVYLSLASGEADLLVKRLLAIQVNSSVSCLLMAFIHYCSELFVFLLLTCRNSFYILDTSLLSVTCFANISQSKAF